MQKRIIAVVAATIVNTIIGFLWYSPFLFGSLWAQLSNVNLEVEMDMGPLIYGTVLALGTACLLSYLIKLMKLNVVRSVRMAFYGWLTFLVPYGLQGCIYAGLAPMLFAINAGYNFVALLAMAAVIAYID